MEIKTIKELNASNDGWFRIDEKENAIDFVESCVKFLGWDDHIKWKWIGFSLSQALYAFCIINLNRNNPGALVQSKDDDAWFERGYDKKKAKVVRQNNRPWYRIIWEPISSIPAPSQEEFTADALIDSAFKNMNRNLIGIWSALARVQDQEWHMSHYGGKAISISDVEMEQIWGLYELLRNDIVHFRPKLISHQIQGVVECCQTVIQKIGFLAFETGNCWLDNEQKRRLQIAVTQVKARLSEAEGMSER
jgi:hypothetical protein